MAMRQGERHGGAREAHAGVGTGGPGCEALAGTHRLGHSGNANEADSTPIMTQQPLPDDNARAPIDRSRASRGGGSIGVVLLIALVLVGAAGAVLLIGTGQSER